MRRQRAFTLLEFLVTLLIVSVALLGLAGIISVGLKNDQSALFRSQAVLLAGDMIDRMRANRPTAEASPSPYNLGLNDTPSGSGVPLNDLTEWRAALAAAFPSGTGSVNVDAATRKVTVVVQWNDARGTGGATNQQMMFETRL